MALQVWLPLNGSTIQQGVSGIIMAGSPSSWGNGKIGKCASFNGSTSNVIYNNTTDFNYTDNFSWTIWVKTNYTGSTAQYIFTNGRADYGGYGYGLQCTSTTNCRCRFGNSTYEITVNGGEWTHLAFTKKGNIVKTYKNGVLWSSYTFGGTLPTYSDGNGLGLGCFHYSDNIYPFYGDINDFRIYDHCLSPREVKEISKGLVLHYPLSDPFLENTTNVLPISAQNFNCTNNDAIAFSYDTSQHGKYTLSGYITRNPATNGTWVNPRITIGAKYSSGTDTMVQDWNSLIDDGKERFINLTITTDSSRTLTKIYGWILDHSSGTTGSKNTIGRNMQLEFKDHATPYTSLTRNENIVYDTSGFCNNGTANGTFNLSSDTPKYNTSTVFNGTDNCIQFPFNDFCTNGDIFTMNIWWKKTELGTKAYETLIGGPGGFEMDTRSGTAQALSLYMASTRGGTLYSPFNMNEWYMITLVNDGTNELYYVNGILVNTIEKKNMPSGNYYVGAWKNETGQNFKGFMSDFRFYKTALSADDILELYHTPETLANNGALLTQGELVES